MGTKSDGGRGHLWKKSDWSKNCPPNAKFNFCYPKHEIQLFKVLLSLKVFKFFKYLGTNLGGGGGGQALVQKRGQVFGWGGGGLTKFSPDGGTPSPLPRKKTLGNCIRQNCFVYPNGLTRIKLKFEIWISGVIIFQTKNTILFWKGTNNDNILNTRSITMTKKKFYFKTFIIDNSHTYV